MVGVVVVVVRSVDLRVLCPASIALSVPSVRSGSVCFVLASSFSSAASADVAVAAAAPAAVPVACEGTEPVVGKDGSIVYQTA